MDYQIPFGEKLATLVVDGVERELNAAVYGENAVLVLTDAFEPSPADFTGRGREPYRAALTVEHGAVSEHRSVRPALVGGTVSDTSMEGARIHSTTPNFNHVIVYDSDYTLKGCDFLADTESDGKRVCDFNGYGSLVCAFGGSRVTLEDCTLESHGVAKPVVFVDGGSNVLLKNCTYRCMGGTLYPGYQNSAGFTKMVAPPWVLGITGSARGTNLMGSCSTMTLVNCDCYANDWGVVSTDGGREMALYVVDSTLTLIGRGNMLDNPFVRRYGPGYGVYVAGCDEFFYGAKFQVGTYAVISTGGSVTMRSSAGQIVPRQKFLTPTGIYHTAFDGHREEVMNVDWKPEPVFQPIQGKGAPTVIESDGWGFMLHGNSKISLEDGTVCNSDYASFLVRAVGAEISIDRSELHPGDGILLQMIDNDDKAVGGTFTPDIFDEEGNLIQPHTGPIFNHEFFEHPGFPGMDYEVTPASSGEVVKFRLTNCDLSGSLYNATGYRGAGDGPKAQGEALAVTIGAGASLTGSITAATARHVDEKGRPNNLFTMEQYYYLGHVENRPWFNGVNHVQVVLEDDGVWNVTGENRLSTLTIGENAAVRPAPGLTLTLTVDGTQMPLEPGKTYDGELVLIAG